MIPAARTRSAPSAKESGPAGLCESVAEERTDLPANLSEAPRPISEVLCDVLGQWSRGELDEPFWNGVFRD